MQLHIRSKNQMLQFFQHTLLIKHMHGECNLLDFSFFT